MCFIYLEKSILTINFAIITVLCHQAPGQSDEGIISTGELILNQGTVIGRRFENLDFFDENINSKVIYFV